MTMVAHKCRKLAYVPLVSADIAWISAFLILCGYAFGYEALIRPLNNGPASNILTIVLMVFAASATHGVIRASHPQPVFFTVIYLGLLISVVRLFEASLGTNYLQVWINSVILSEFPINRELPNVTSWNTALFFTCYFVALWGFRTPRLKVMLASMGIAAVILVVAWIGYALGVPALYGNMSMITGSICSILLIGLGSLCIVTRPRDNSRD
ncbi:hypothetical protein I3V23_00315 [Rhodobacterales bacterium HKCCA1288]|nr:hypothetical protein I3V23_00315 [Rhodobacterales bacterium HKCCA1288]